MTERNIESSHICTSEDKQHILIHGTRTTHAQKLLCNTLNGTMSAPENISSIQYFIKLLADEDKDMETQPSSSSTIERFLIGWTDEEEEGTFVNVDTGYLTRHWRIGIRASQMGVGWKTALS